MHFGLANLMKSCAKVRLFLRWINKKKYSPYIFRAVILMNDYALDTLMYKELGLPSACFLPKQFDFFKHVM